MSDLHRNSCFLRFLRSICSKTACARRAIVALFVAVATILATFMIMPSASMGASQQGEPKQAQTQSEKTENKTAADNKVATQGEAPAKDGAAAKGDAGDSETKESNTAEPKNSQTPSKQGGSDADHTQNVDSEKKQNPAKDAKKDAEKSESAKESRRQERSVKEENRDATGSVPLPEACKKAGKSIKFFRDCYVLLYNNSEEKLTLDVQLDGKAENISPAFKMYKDKKKKILVDAVTPSNIVFKLVKLKGNKKNEYIPIPDWVKFKNPDSNDPNSSSDGVIAIHPVGKWTECKQYEFGIQVQYPDYSAKNRKTHSSIFKINVNVKKDVSSSDLELNVYNHEDSDPKPSKIDDKTGITFESGEDGKYSTITPIFIDSKSTKKPGLIYHHMICHKESSSDGSGDSNDNYTVDKVNGLSLGVKNGASGTQTQFKHENKIRPNKNADAYAVYENDPYTEESQSLISGKPSGDGTFECKVFAVKNVGISNSSNNGKTFSTEYFAEYVTNRINDNNSAVFENPDTNIYEAHIPNTNTSGLDVSVYNPQKTIDWDVKTIKIVVKSNKKQKLDVKDGDLKLNVYPFKSDDAGSSKPGASAPSVLADGDTVSVMKGIELKPFVEATSDADSQKAITLKLLCSKGEQPQKNKAGDKKTEVNAASTTNVNSAGGADNAANTSNKDFVYTKWVDPSKLGFSFPDGEAQNPCTSNEGEQTCSLDGSATKFAATTNASATFKSAEAGDYKCVVYALKKPDALNKFNEVTTDVTPDNISAAFKKANLTANKDFAQLAFYIHVTETFDDLLPHTGEWNWNLQLGAIAAVMVSVLAAGFVASQNDAYRKLFYERRRC